MIKEDNLLGLDWSHYCKSLLATYQRNSAVVKFWDLNNHKSETAKVVLLNEIQNTSAKKSGLKSGGRKQPASKKSPGAS